MTPRALIRESVGRDTVNWSRALTLWERHTNLRPSGRRALEVGVGGTYGNLSPWLAVALQRAAVRNMWRALRADGELWFADGMRGSRLHEGLRNHFGWGRRGWRHLSVSELDRCCHRSKASTSRSSGFSACSGVRRSSAAPSGVVDRVVCERFVPEPSRYLLAGVARQGPAP